jgi:hypothetical protein
MFGKDKNGRLKRIEYRGKYLRASRTGGVALRAQTKVSGIHLTANSKHGLRASTRVAKGTQVAFQNGRFILRGRYGRGPTKLNLSKSGVSVSTKTGTGTINWFKPRYSSAKIAGIQVRGKNALYLHALLALVQILVSLTLLLVQALVLSVQVVYWLAVTLTTQAKRRWAMRHAKTIQTAEARWLEALSTKDDTWLLEGLKWCFLHLGHGETWESHLKSENQIADELTTYLATSQLPQPLNLEILFGCLAETYERTAGEDPCLELFFDLDSAAVAAGGRNQLQERLLAAYAACCGIDLTDGPPESHSK